MIISPTRQSIFSPNQYYRHRILFLESEYLKHLDSKYGGAIALRQDKWDNNDSSKL